MKTEGLAKELRDCFKDSEKDEKDGKKHKSEIISGRSWSRNAHKFADRA